MSFARPSRCASSRTFTYAVEVPGIGEVLKTDCCIAHARRWARRAFAPLVCTVRRHVEPTPAPVPLGSLLRRFDPGLAAAARAFRRSARVED